MKWLIYNIETGDLEGWGEGNIPPSNENLTIGYNWLEHDRVDPLTHHVVNGAVVLREEVIIPEGPKKFYTFNQWVDMFPFPEQVAIVQATMTDPVAKLIYDRASSASGEIDAKDPRTVEGLGYLLSQGYISQSTFDTINNMPS